MRGEVLIPYVLTGFAGITAVNLLIQFFQLIREKCKKCSIIKIEQKNIKNKTETHILRN